MSPHPELDDPGAEQPFISHLIELRDRLMRMAIAIFVVFLALFPFANDIYTYVAAPLMAQLPQGSTMIATQVASPFLTPFKLALVAAVFVAMPYLLYQVWSFVAPGLYQHEKRLAMPLLVSSIVLFYLGMLFAYYVVFPLVFAFLSGTTPDGVSMMTDISAYLDFVLTLFFAFGVAFEIPIATILAGGDGSDHTRRPGQQASLCRRRRVRRRHVADAAGRDLADAARAADVAAVRARHRPVPGADAPASGACGRRGRGGRGPGGPVCR